MTRLIEPNGAEPLYTQLAAQLRQALLTGQYPSGSRIPSEAELCAAYQVSRVTVRKALAQLTAEGLLEKRQGKGTFAAGPHLQRDLKHINSFNDTCLAMGLTPETRVIYARQVELASLPPREAAFVSLEGATQAVEVCRLRSANGEPVMLETNCFPLTYTWLLEEDVSGSLYALLGTHGICPGQAAHEISLAYADEVIAILLEVHAGDALLCLRELIYDQQGQPLHTSLQHIRGDRFTFHI